MEMSMDTGFIVPALLFTLLAVALTAVLFRKQSPAGSASTRRQKNTSCSKELLSDKDTDSEFTNNTIQDLEEDQFKSMQNITSNNCEALLAENESTSLPSVKTMSSEDKPLRYMPGMLRTSQLEKMMSKEELEEERRVQHEQLAAIFKLLKENQDTFGKVTEKDMEEQLKLYSI